MNVWKELIDGFRNGPITTASDPPYNITVTCEECGRRHRLERPRWRDEDIWIVCHDCEAPILSRLRLSAHGL